MEGLQWMHSEFCRDLHKNSLAVTSDSGSTETMSPGQLRTQQVTVGRHLAPDPGDLGRLLRRFFSVYDPSKFSGTQRIVAAVAAHHRFLWIHPFLDFNGRLARLLTQWQLEEAVPYIRGLWSLSRGILSRVDEYKSLLSRADYPRQGARDGRGARSEKNLIGFCQFMLEVAIEELMTNE